MNARALSPRILLCRINFRQARPPNSAANDPSDVGTQGIGEAKPSLRPKVDGNFDRTGLPDPVINHRVKVDGDKIIALTCRLANEQPPT